MDDEKDISKTFTYILHLFFNLFNILNVLSASILMVQVSVSIHMILIAFIQCMILFSISKNSDLLIFKMDKPLR